MSDEASGIQGMLSRAEKLDAEGKVHDPAEDECDSRRTVQVGNLSAIDLKCMLQRWQHREPLHRTSRSFGDVTMTAHWSGEFVEPSE